MSIILNGTEIEVDDEGYLLDTTLTGHRNWPSCWPAKRIWN